MAAAAGEELHDFDEEEEAVGEVSTSSNGGLMFVERAWGLMLTEIRSRERRRMFIFVLVKVGLG